MPAFAQSSFSRGEISPAMYGRVDVASYEVALRTARNMIIHPQGGCSNRPGTSFIGPVKDHARKVRLFPFQFKAADQYVLEFGHLYIRVIRNDGHVVETATATVTAVSLTNPIQITAVAHGYSVDDEVFFVGIGGTIELNGNRFVLTNVSTDSFSLLNQGTLAPIDGTDFTAFTSGGTAGRIFTLTTPYDESDLFELKIVQSADIMTITHRDYAPRDLARTDHDAWTITIPSFAPGQVGPTNVAIVATMTGSQTDRYKVTAIKDETFEESLTGLSDEAAINITAISKANPAVVTLTNNTHVDGDEILIQSVGGMTELNDRRFIVTSRTGTTIALTGEDSTNHTTYTSGGTTTETHREVTNGAIPTENTISWTAAVGAFKYAIYRLDNGIYGLIGETELTTFQDIAEIPDLSITPPRARNPFLLSGTFPGTSSYYEQRQVYGGSTDAPDTSFYSRTADRLNFSRASPLQDDDAITVTLTSRQVNEIRHYVPMSDLMVFTSGEEWRINHASDAAFTPFTIQQKPQSQFGSSHLPPEVVGSLAIYIENGGARVRTLGFDFALDSYKGSDLTLISEHLLANEGPDSFIISDWTYTSSPESRAYFVRSDGDALTLTFDAEQKVIAWTHWDTDGLYESVTSLKKSLSSVEDGVYWVVQRTCNGQSFRSIERMNTRKFADVKDATFLDSTFTLNLPVTITNIQTVNGVTVITAVGHGFANGDLVDFADITWASTIDEFGVETIPTGLNGRRFSVSTADTNTFQINLVSDISGWNLSTLTSDSLSLDVSSETSDPEDIVWSGDGLKIYVTTTNNDTIYQYAVAGTFDLAGAIFDASVVFTAEDSSPKALVIQDDGLAAWVLGSNSATVYQYTLATAHDLTTATFDNVSLDVSSEDSAPIHMAINSDGTKLFILGDTNDSIYQYTMSTAHDLSTASHDSVSLDISLFTTSPREIMFTPDGLILVLSGLGSSTFYSFVLATGFELTTASFEFPFTSENDNNTPKLVFKDDGLKVYVLGQENNTVYEYNVGSAHDLSTALYNDVSISIASEDTTPQGMDIRPDTGTKLWVAGDANDAVFQYSMTGDDVNNTDTYVRGGEVRVAVETVSGLAPLCGTNLVAMVDGNVIDPAPTINAAGEMTFTTAASRIHVGLRYISDFETLDVPIPDTKVLGKKFKIPAVTVVFEKTRGGLYGPDENSLIEMKQRKDEALEDPIELFTGPKKIVIGPQWNSNGRIFIRQKDPLPMTILSVNPDIIIEDPLK